MAKQYDVAVIGAGAAGMMCAAVAAQRGKRVVLIDHAGKLAEKIRISGGGRCNFTNLQAGPQNFLSDNPHFCKSALSRYTPQDFLALIKKYRIAYHEKHKGQLFCNESAEQIIDMLKDECAASDVHWRMPCKIGSLARRPEGGFLLGTDSGDIVAGSVVVATGGLSIPKIGATDFAYRIAQQFDLRLVEPRPALVPLTFDPAIWAPYAELSGIALEVDVETGSLKGRNPSGARFREDLLFTHRGLSGPAILQISSFWQPGTPIVVNLLPEMDVAATLIEGKGSLKKQLGNIVSQWLPVRLADSLLSANGLAADARIADLPDATLRKLGQAINQWSIVPNGSEGYRKAEVTRGGIDTRELSQQTMMANKVPGLYFIGESVDVTGWLGGYNFQWAWASGVAAGMALQSEQ
ncbi:NAD(P)/FAD-dependent oxidoreductase [Janthinobacterium agaricidamnosum]|uniref:Pyridine nucleotide-disulphide oxidoreductase family protein n=1 Tax=Janthinobacterium agaricidamnosum NBRC 102515 = DSM 9628 TaxID=1349767 RepID=W0V0Z5_9BURK|nr:NAD(P)/FAD-dependent oxidoreductase [Janthinobacterium agaricidamnosum]CDG81541.1 pyridine nucleotide-disulphide oxidoreductase family protein [Janthinobacterium agaricidamnosum NBRC 102515 = DSM 9628]